MGDRSARDIRINPYDNNEIPVDTFFGRFDGARIVRGRAT
jgi:hypothetical protein